MCAERVQCGGLAHTRMRYAGRDVAGCWLLLDWMEGAWSRRSDVEGAVAVREVVGGGENGSRREGGSCGCGGRMVDLAGS